MKISVVVPTYKEALNIPVLTEQIDDAFKSTDYQYEIIFVDDNSQDGTIEAVAKLQKKYSVRLETRMTEKGLSSAVIKGFDLADGDVYICMDADLSHPPVALPQMADEIKNGADFVIGSRNVKGGSADSFNFYRKLNAWVSRTMARPFAKVSDPMAGFFAFPAFLYTPDVRKILNPIGWKIGLEMLVKAKPQNAKEIPIKFQERLYGESKLSLKEQLNYIKHLYRLGEFKYRGFVEFIKFCFVGLSGSLVDLSLFALFKWIFELASMPAAFINNSFEIARFIGIFTAMNTNFFLNRAITFKTKGNSHKWREYFSFIGVSSCGLIANWFASVYLKNNTGYFEQHYMLAAVMGILAGTAVNFLGSKFIAFRPRKNK